MKRASNDAELLLELAKDAQVFCTAWGDSYADIEIGGHRETWPLTSNEFANWLTGRLYQSHGCAVGQAAFATAIRTLTAKASLKAEKRPVFLRVADFQGMRYLDLCNDRWEAVEISSTGWKVVAKPPVRFLRLPGMQSLPHPKRGGKIDALRPFLGNIADDGFVLVIGYLLVVLNARGPYPLLVFTGTQGSAKSSATRVTRRLIDPCIDLLGAVPHTQQEESRAVANNFIQAWDNVSQLDGRTSDRLPNGPSPLSEALTRAEPVLERLGIAVIRHRAGPAGSRMIEIKRVGPRTPTAAKKQPKPTKVRPFSERSNQLCLALTDDTDDN